MQFEQDSFREYKRIMETTNVQKCYQQILKLIRYISSELIRRCGQKVGLDTLKREIERCIQKNNITKRSRFMKRRDQ